MAEWATGRMELNPPASEEEVQAAQAALGVQFPEDYIAFLKHSNGAEGKIGEAGWLWLYPLADVVSSTKELWRISEEDGLDGLDDLHPYVHLGSDGGAETYMLNPSLPQIYEWELLALEPVDGIPVGGTLNDLLAYAARGR
jgi:hypothetical protein